MPPLFSGLQDDDQEKLIGGLQVHHFALDFARAVHETNKGKSLGHELLLQAPAYTKSEFNFPGLGTTFRF